MTTETQNVAAATWEPIEGQTRNFTLEPINEANGLAVTREATFTFGRYTGKPNAEGNVPAAKGRWQVEIVRVVDGIQDVVDGRAPDPKKALANCLKAVTSAVSVDDYDLSFFDDEKEYFGQKLAAPKKPAFDPETIVTMGDDEMSLAEVRGVVETDLTTIKDKGIEGQRAMLHAATAIKTVWVALGRNIKAVKAWASSGDGANVPQLTQLGEGVNALQEFIDIGRLRPSEVDALPVSLTSGKGVNQFRGTAQSTVLNGANGDSAGPIQRFAAEHDHDPAQVFAGDLWVGDGDDAKRVLNPNGIAKMLRTIAADDRLTGIANADDLSLDQLCDEFDKRVAARLDRFLGEGGKHYSMYNEVEASAMRRVYGLVQMAGETEPDNHNMSGAFRKAAEFAKALNLAIEGKDDKLVSDKLAKSLNPRLNPLLAAINKGLAAECEARAKERQVRELHNKVDEAGEGIAKAERKRFADLDAAGAAARLYSLLTSRMGENTPDDAKDVYAILGQLLRSEPVQDAAE